MSGLSAVKKSDSQEDLTVSQPLVEKKGTLETNSGTRKLVELPKDAKTGSIKEKCLTACNIDSVIKWVLIAVIVAGLVVGTAGLFVYLKKLVLGIQNVGTLSQVHGFYTMVGGYGALIVASIVLAIKARLDCLREMKGTAPDAKTSKNPPNLGKTEHTT